MYDALVQALGAAGIVLDTPGSIARGLGSAAVRGLGGDQSGSQRDLGRAFGGIFDPEQRVRGEEWTGDPWSGAVAEIATDPTNIFGGLALAKAMKAGGAIRAVKGNMDVARTIQDAVQSAAKIHLRDKAALAAGAVDDLAAKAAPTGMTRFYHGGVPGEGARFVSPDPNYARGYANKSTGGIVQYVDVPNNSPLLRKAFDDTGATVKSPFVSFEAPAEIMRTARPFGTAPGTALAPEGVDLAADAGRTYNPALMEALPDVPTSRTFKRVQPALAKHIEDMGLGYRVPTKAGRKTSEVVVNMDPEAFAAMAKGKQGTMGMAGNPFDRTMGGNPLMRNQNLMAEATNLPDHGLGALGDDAAGYGGMGQSQSGFPPYGSTPGSEALRDEFMPTGAGYQRLGDMPLDQAMMGANYNMTGVQQQLAAMLRQRGIGAGPLAAMLGGHNLLARQGA